jgi:hypothetical protein
MAVKYRCLLQSKCCYSECGVNTDLGYDCSKADTCDVINYEEYEDVTNKVLEKKPTRAITIFVDMKDIEKIGLADAEDRSDNNDEADVSDAYLHAFNLMFLL